MNTVDYNIMLENDFVVLDEIKNYLSKASYIEGKGRVKGLYDVLYDGLEKATYNLDEEGNLRIGFDFTEKQKRHILDVNNFLKHIKKVRRELERRNKIVGIVYYHKYLDSRPSLPDHVKLVVTYIKNVYHGKNKPFETYTVTNTSYVIVEYKKKKTKEKLESAVEQAYYAIIERIKELMVSNAKIIGIPTYIYFVISQEELNEHSHNPLIIKMYMKTPIDYKFIKGISLNVPKEFGYCVVTYLLEFFGKKITTLTLKKIDEIIDGVIYCPNYVPGGKGRNCEEILRFCQFYKISMYALDVNNKVFFKWIAKVERDDGTYTSSNYPALIFYMINQHLYPVTDKPTRERIVKQESFKERKDSSYSLILCNKHESKDVERDIIERFELPFYEDIKIEDLSKYKNCNIFYHKLDLYDVLVKLILERNVQYESVYKGDNIVKIKIENDVMLYSNVNHTFGGDWNLAIDLCKKFKIPFKNQTLSSISNEIYTQISPRSSQQFLKNNISNNDKIKILNNQECKCSICDIKLKSKYIIDHIRPLSSGGKNVIKNLQAICNKCYRDKVAQNSVENKFRVDNITSMFNDVTKEIFSKRKNGIIHCFANKHNESKFKYKSKKYKMIKKMIDDDIYILCNLKKIFPNIDIDNYKCKCNKKSFDEIIVMKDYDKDLKDGKLKGTLCDKYLHSLCKICKYRVLLQDECVQKKEAFNKNSCCRVTKAEYYSNLNEYVQGQFRDEFDMDLSDYKCECNKINVFEIENMNDTELTNFGETLCEKCLFKLNLITEFEENNELIEDENDSIQCTFTDDCCCNKCDSHSKQFQIFTKRNDRYYFSLDVKRSRKNILRYSKHNYCVYSILDDPIDYVHKEGKKLKTGFYYIETDNLLPFKGNGWYSGPVVEYGLNENISEIDGEKEMMIKPHQIKYFIKPSLVLKYDEFVKYVEHVYKFGGDSSKMLVNSFIGTFGHKISKFGKIIFTRSLNDVSYHLFTQKTCKVSKVHRERTEQEKKDNPDSTDEYVEINDLFEIIYKTEKYCEDSCVPIYNQILDLEAIELHKLSKLFKKHNGKVLFVNTDCVVGEFVDKKDIKELELEASTKYWDYKNEFPKYQEDDIKIDNKRKEYINSESLRYNKLEYKTINDPKNNNFDKFADELIKMDKSFQIDARAGCGKTFLLKKIIENLQKNNKKILSLAPTHKACRLLSKDSSTMHSVFIKMSPKSIFNRADYVIIDEKSMIKELFFKLLYGVKNNTKCKFIICGDWFQLPPVLDRAEFNYENSNIIHQICDGNLVKLTECRRSDRRLFNLCMDVNKVNVNDFSSKLQEKSICYHNNKRREINHGLMKIKAKGKCLKLPKLPDKKESQDILIYKGLPIIAYRTNLTYDIANAEEFIIKSYDKNEKSIKIWCEGMADKDIQFSDFQKIFYPGYCITVHKSQGSTFNYPYSIIEWDEMDERLKYVALSRATKLQDISIC